MPGRLAIASLRHHHDRPRNRARASEGTPIGPTSSMIRQVSILSSWVFRQHPPCEPASAGRGERRYAGFASLRNHRRFCWVSVGLIGKDPAQRLIDSFSPGGKSVFPMALWPGSAGVVGSSTIGPDLRVGEGVGGLAVGLGGQLLSSEALRQRVRGKGDDRVVGPGRH